MSFRSISGGCTELAGVGGCDALSVGVDPHGLDGGVTLWPDLDQVLSCAQCADQIFGVGFFHKQERWEPLVMDAWCGDRVGGVFASKEDVQEGLEGACNDRGAARCTDAEDGLSVACDEGRGHTGERSFVGGDGVGCALDETESVGFSGVGGKVIHLVVEQDAGVLGDDLRTKSRVDGGGHGNCVSVGIDHADVRGSAVAVGSSGRKFGASVLGPRQNAVGSDACGECFGVSG